MGRLNPFHPWFFLTPNGIPSNPTQAATLATGDQTTFTLSPAIKLSELEVYRGGARIFAANGDFTATGDPVTSITLTTALQNGETLNVLGTTS